MRDVQGIPEERIVLAPLGGLTVDVKGARFRERTPGEPFTVSFVGRLARQKAPEVFVAGTAAPLVLSLTHSHGVARKNDKLLQDAENYTKDAAFLAGLVRR